MADLRVSAPVEAALKQLRENLSDINARILSFERIEAEKRHAAVRSLKQIAEEQAPKKDGPLKSGKEETGGREHSDRIKSKQLKSKLAKDYSEVHSAIHWSLDAKSWATFMRQDIQLPLWMLPMVQLVIRRRAWRKTADPLGRIRAASKREAARLGLRGPVT